MEIQEKILVHQSAAHHFAESCDTARAPIDCLDLFTRRTRASCLDTSLHRQCQRALQYTVDRHGDRRGCHRPGLHTLHIMGRVPRETARFERRKGEDATYLS